MRISSQSNQFIFHFPADFLPKYLYDQFQILLDKNFIPYDDALMYVNSTIKEMVFPSMSFEMVTQTIKRGKKINWKEAGHIMDKFGHDLDITFRSVDSHLNYFILVQILSDFYANTQQTYIPYFNISILDKDGDAIYTIVLKDIILKSVSELRMTYQQQDFGEKTFTVSFTYNWLDIVWGVGVGELEEKSIFDIPEDRGNNVEGVESLEKQKERSRKIDEKLLPDKHKPFNLNDRLVERPKADEPPLRKI